MLVQYEQIILVAFKEIEDALVTIVQLYKTLGGKMVAGIRRQALRS